HYYCMIWHNNAYWVF
nr:immunoglobulin light chain junction region [Macaca mulatta]